MPKKASPVFTFFVISSVSIFSRVQPQDVSQVVVGDTDWNRTWGLICDKKCPTFFYEFVISRDEDSLGFFKNTVSVSSSEPIDCR